MEHTIICQYTEGMAFEADVNEHTVVMDSETEFGGRDSGPRPKPLLLVSLAGCTGMDVVALLEKMRVSYADFKVEVSGTLTEEHPKYYHKIHIIYRFQGDDLPLDKLEKAVQLSQEKYCGVSAMLSKAAQISHEIVLD
ncbi:MAG: OsmC family protein [Microscillaceae bacterium]|nr:OsmC family protein [Microscillaceae bacterium]